MKNKAKTVINPNRPLEPYTPRAYEVLAEPPKLDGVKGHTHYDLLHMLTYMRPYGSKTEQDFCDKFISPIASSQDGFGNYHVEVLNPKGEMSKVLFSAHTDTVHRDEGFQNLSIDANLDVVTALNSTCLGADDTTGIYLMLNMIKARVPGHYIFHRGEEVGCLGSKWIEENTPDIFEAIDIAVAFDRKGITEVITEQSTGKCASNECGQQLSDMFNGFSDKLGFAPSPHGVYTDTAHYNGLISECFNLGVGYYDQHTNKERQDLRFLDTFLEACKSIAWEELIAVRDVQDFGYLETASDPWGTFPSQTELLELMETNPLGFAEFLIYEQLVTLDDMEYYIPFMGVAKKPHKKPGKKPGKKMAIETLHTVSEPLTEMDLGGLNRF